MHCSPHIRARIKSSCKAGLAEHIQNNLGTNFPAIILGTMTSFSSTTLPITPRPCKRSTNSLPTISITIYFLHILESQSSHSLARSALLTAYIWTFIPARVCVEASSGNLIIKEKTTRKHVHNENLRNARPHRRRAASTPWEFHLPSTRGRHAFTARMATLSIVQRRRTIC